MREVDDAMRAWNPVTANTASVGCGKEIFRTHFLSCPGGGGRGDGLVGMALSPLPVDLATMAPGHTGGDLACKIAAGRGATPLCKGALNPPQIWDVVNYLSKRALGAGKAGI